MDSKHILMFVAVIALLCFVIYTTMTGNNVDIVSMMGPILSSVMDKGNSVKPSQGSQ